MTNIEVKKDVWKNLNKIKMELELKSMSDTVGYLLNYMINRRKVTAKEFGLKQVCIDLPKIKAITTLEIINMEKDLNEND